MNVFRLNNVGIIEIAYPEITIYKEFHNIVTTYPSNYDLYFKYVYLLSDYKSKCNQEGFTEKESIQYATSLLGLTKEQVNNDLINNAIIRYRELNGSIIRDNLSTLKRALAKTNKIISVLDNKLEIMLYKLDSSDEEIEGETYKPILDLVNKIFSLSTDVPKHIRSIDELEKLISSDSEQKVKELARGKKTIEDSYNPDNEIERDV